MLASPRSAGLSPALPACAACSPGTNRPAEAGGRARAGSLTHPIAFRPPLPPPRRSFSKDENCHSAPDSRVGTAAYLAPEVITSRQGQAYDGKVGRQ